MAVISPTLRSARLLALLLPAGLLMGAYVGQFGFGLYPCEMCWWQRYAHFAAVGLAAISFLPAAGSARTWVVLAGLAIVVSGLIGGFHAGVEWGWWSGFTTCAAPATGTGDPLAAILAAPLVPCGIAQWRLLGISLAGWNCLFSVGGAAAIALLLTSAPRDGIVERSPG